MQNACRLISCMYLAVAIAGCGEMLNGQRSNLAGGWRCTESQGRYFLPDGQVNEEQYSGSPNVAVIVRSDGTFNLRGSMYALLVPDHLRYKGNRAVIAGMPGRPTIKVIESQYTPNESKIVFQVQGHPELDTLSLEARLETETTAWMQVAQKYRNGTKAIETYQLLREGVELKQSEDFVRQFTGHESTIRCINFTPEGKHIVSAGYDKIIRLWDIENGDECRRFLGHEYPISALAVSSDGRFLASGSYRLVGNSLDPCTIRLWDLRRGQEIQCLKGLTHVSALAFAPDDRFMIEAGYLDPRELSNLTAPHAPLRMWNLGTMEIQCSYKHESRGSCMDAVFNPHGTIIAAHMSACMKDPILLWDVKSGQVIRQLGGEISGSLHDMVFSADGSFVYCGGVDGFVHGFNIETGQEVFRSNTHASEVYCLACSPDGRSVLSGHRNGMTYVWDANTGDMKKCYKQHLGEVTSVAISPDGSYAATAGEDGIIRLWLLAVHGE